MNVVDAIVLCTKNAHINPITMYACVCVGSCTHIHVHLLGKPSASRIRLTLFNEVGNSFVALPLFDQWCWFLLLVIVVAVCERASVCLCLFLVQKFTVHVIRMLLYFTTSRCSLWGCLRTATRKNRTVELCFSCTIDVVPPLVSILQIR